MGKYSQIQSPPSVQHFYTQRQAITLPDGIPTSHFRPPLPSLQPLDTP
jgi:hypothetical protein